MASKIALTAPIASDGSEAHADWLEVLALSAPDGDSSFQDLVSEVRRAGTLDAFSDQDGLDTGSEKSQVLASDAFARLDLRAKACGDSYPFVIDDQTVTVKDADEAKRSPYSFMLLLRMFGVCAGPRGIKGATHFEELCERAASQYLGGHALGVESYHFGFPRRTSPSGFRAALDELCRRLGEGGGARDTPARRNQKDAKLDLVAWRPFPDLRAGKLIAFGQCAAGDNWDGKVTELSPRSFIYQWTNTRIFGFEPLVFFFVPRCLDDAEWESVSSQGDTIPFDRCRISLLLSEAGLSGDLEARTRRWVQAVLGRIQR